ncbi:hypothetical protein FM106_05090 [Brachybacterium faecium]|nr:hypothetical protein FM106_05090 [Brachybacterium faecium]
MHGAAGRRLTAGPLLAPGPLTSSASTGGQENHRGGTHGHQSLHRDLHAGSSRDGENVSAAALARTPLRHGSSSPGRRCIASPVCCVTCHMAAAP